MIFLGNPRGETRRRQALTVLVRERRAAAGVVGRRDRYCLLVEPGVVVGVRVVVARGEDDDALDALAAVGCAVRAVSQRYSC